MPLVQPGATPPLPRSERHSLAVPTRFPRNASTLEKVQHFVSIGGPIGFIPWVPATWASLLTAALCWVAWPHQAWVVIACVLAFIFGVRTATVSERLLGTADPRNVVIDEIGGQALVFVIVGAATWQLALAGFIAFRVFDITKLWPARALERLPGGWGIMADDFIAGLYAALVLWVVRRWLL